MPWCMQVDDVSCHGVCRWLVCRALVYAGGWCVVPWCMQVVGVYLVVVFCVLYVDDSMHMVGMYRVHGITLVYSDVNLRLNLNMLGTQS